MERTRGITARAYYTMYTSRNIDPPYHISDRCMSIMVLTFFPSPPLIILMVIIELEVALAKKNNFDVPKITRFLALKESSLSIVYSADSY